MGKSRLGWKGRVDSGGRCGSPTRGQQEAKEAMIREKGTAELDWETHSSSYQEVSYKDPALAWESEAMKPELEWRRMPLIRNLKR